MKEILEIGVDMNYISHQISTPDSTSFRRNKKRQISKKKIKFVFFCFSWMKLSLELRFGENVFHIYIYL